jgi:hypothetical protein
MAQILSNRQRESSWTLQQFQMSHGTSPTTMDELVTGFEAGTSLQELNLSYCTFHWHNDDTHGRHESTMIQIHRTNSIKKEKDEN